MYLMPPFHSEAVAAVVEEGVRLAGDRNKLTTRFTKIADLVSEAGHWAMQAGASPVRPEHVDRALTKRAYRFNLVEELLRERGAASSSSSRRSGAASRVVG